MAGPFPPSPDPAAAAALRTVQELLAEGHAVEVVSPLPSAADHHGPLAGLKGAIALARRARGFDALHLQVGRGLLFRPEQPQARRVLDSAALALSLRLWRRTVADVGDMSDVPGGGGGLSGRLIWGAVDEIRVSSEPVRNHVTVVLHMPAARVRVEAGSRGSGPVVGSTRSAPPPDLAPWQENGPLDWDYLTAAVRERAATERARLQGGPDGDG
ncbi:MAG: hypothetical protein ABR532_01120 [Candidatus Dormibacteria bacterium]